MLPLGEEVPVILDLGIVTLDPYDPAVVPVHQDGPVQIKIVHDHVHWHKNGRVVPDGPLGILIPPGGGGRILGQVKHHSAVGLVEEDHHIVPVACKNPQPYPRGVGVEDLIGNIDLSTGQKGHRLIPQLQNRVIDRGKIDGLPNDGQGRAQQSQNAGSGQSQGAQDLEPFFLHAAPLLSLVSDTGGKCRAALPPPVSHVFFIIPEPVPSVNGKKRK